MKHILAAAGILTGLGALALDLWRYGKEFGYGRIFVSRISGYDYVFKDFDASRAVAGIPILVGVGGSYLAAKSGVNAYTPKGWNL